MARRKYKNAPPPARRVSGRRGPKIPRGRVTKRDSFGNTYGGTITSLKLHKNQDFSPKPTAPLRDADYSTAQMINSVAIGAGFTNGNTTNLPYIQAQPGANEYFSFGFSFQDLPQAATMAALFDQYRFDRVEVKLVPQSNNVALSAATSPNNSNPSILAVLDFDDSLAPTTLLGVQEYDNVQISEYGEGLMATITPSMTPAVYASGAFTGYAVEKAGWLDVASTTIAHYGLKGVVTELTALSTQTCVWNLYIKYFVSFRNTR